MNIMLKMILNMGKRKRTPNPNKGIPKVRINEGTQQKKKIEQILKRKLLFERKIYSIFSRFIGKNIDKAINTSLGEIGRLSGASRTYLFLFKEDGTRMDNTHEWCAKGISSEIDNLQNLPTDMFPWWIAKLHKDKIIHITDVSKMPAAAKAEKEILETQDIKSLLVIPVHIRGKLRGFIGFDNVLKTGEWNDDDIALLRISSDIIGYTINQKCTDDALKESEQRFRTLFDTAMDAIFLSDETGRFQDVNKSACKMLRYSREELLKLSNRDIDVEPTGYEAFLKVQAGVIKKAMFKVNQRRKDGTHQPVEIMGNSFTNNGKRIFLAIARDITERKISEELIEKEKEKAEKYLNLAGNIIIALCPKARITMLNKKGYEVLGYKQGELIGNNWFETCIPEEKRADVKKVFRKIMQGNLKIAEHYENLVITKQGDKRIISWYNSVLKNDKGDITGILSSGTDITDNKKAEAEIKRYTKELETMVKERTKKLSRSNEELKGRVDELERFHNLVVGRELKMIELKNRIKNLEKLKKKS